MATDLMISTVRVVHLKTDNRVVVVTDDSRRAMELMGS